MSYYNTTHERGQLLLDFHRAAAVQDQLVLDVFRRYNFALAPSEVYRHLVNNRLIHAGVPITSIRRSITNLTGEGRLTKMPGKKIGPYNRPEYTWTIKND